MTNFIKTTLLAAMLLAQAASARTVLGIEGEEATSVGIYIKDLSTGQTIIDHNSSLALTPASVMKALTTATVLSLSGTDKCFTTPVVLSGHADGETWHGNLIIESSADPTLESENFKSKLGFCDSIASRLKSMGVTRIEGSTLVEQSLKDAGPVVQWEIEDVAWPYGAGLYGFNWRDNTVKITPATGEVVPEAPGLEICVEKAKSNDLLRGIDSNRLTVYTRDPDDEKYTLSTTVPDPAAVFKAQLREVLGREGIEIGDEELAPDTLRTTVYTHRSATYGDIMKSLMVRSDNLFAEGMLRTIAPGASRKEAIKRERDLWSKRNIDMRRTIINDGSGLTRANRLPARLIGDVLEWMARSQMADTYTSFFPRAGKDGTMRGFLAKSSLKGRIALKTGSVSSVQCYAGYKLDANDKPTHVVVILVNGFFCPRKNVREACEKLLTETFAGKPASNQSAVSSKPKKTAGASTAKKTSKKTRKTTKKTNKARR